MKSPSKAALRRAKREAETAALEKGALDFWFEVSGTTMADLETAIDYWDARHRNPCRLGVDAEVAAPVMEHPRLSGPAKIAIVRAMQRISAHRAMASKAGNDAQGSLFF